MIDDNLSRREFVRTGISTAGVLFTNADVFNTESEAPSSNSLDDLCASSEIRNKNSTLDREVFLNPGTEYRGVALWMLNDKLEMNEALRQLQGMKYAGWGRVILRRYTGLLDSPYRTKWNEILREVLKACETNKMGVFLQEGNVPFPDMKEAYGHKMLVRRPVNEPQHKNETLITRVGDFAYYQSLSAGEAGTTTAFRIIDTLDPEAMSAYFKALFSYLYANFGYAFGKTIDAVWVDEPEARRVTGLPADSVPWTTMLPETFEKEWGYSLIENLPSLFAEVGNYHKVRNHYWRTVCSMFSFAYWKLMGAWCEKYQVKFAGHQYGEDSFSRQMHHTINCMPHYEYMQLPGIDHLTGDLHWPSGDPFIMPPKQVSSVAHQLGKREVLCEMYGVSDQGTSFEDRKWIYQWLAVLGINYRCYHGAFYSMRGMRKRVWPVTMNYQQPWWDDNRIISDFGARLSYALRQGKYKADILIINPIESYYLDPQLEKNEPTASGPLDKDFIELSHNLLKIQRLFDYGDESLLAKYGKVVDNTLLVGEMAYKIVLLPSLMTLRKSTVDMLSKFLDDGGVIISAGTLPNLIDGASDQNIESFNKRIIKTVNETGTLNSVLCGVVPPEIQIIPITGVSAETIWVHQREIKNGRMFFLTNISREVTIDIEIRIKGKGKLEYWNLETGMVENIAQKTEGDFIITQLEFAPTGSHMLVLNENVKAEYLQEKISKTVWQVPLQKYQIIRHDPNAITLDYCKYKKEGGIWSEMLPMVGVGEILNDEKYSGHLSLQYEFTAETKPKRCAVVIENAGDYTVLINGNQVTYEGLPYYRDRSFHPIDISHLVKSGTNVGHLSCHFQAGDPKEVDNEKLFGTELEAIYLIGEFAVKGNYTGRDRFESVRHRYQPPFMLTNETNSSNGDLLADGYCFFNGSLSLITTGILRKRERSGKIFLEIEQLNSTLAKIKVNNKEAGTLAWKPYRIDITDLVWEGENKIEICLTNSLRNLLGAFHYVPVPVSNPWPYEFSGRAYDGPDWLEKRAQGIAKSWSDDYFFRPFGIEGNVMITGNNLV